MVELQILIGAFLLISHTLLIQCSESSLYSPNAQKRLKEKIKHDTDKRRTNKRKPNNYCESINSSHLKVKKKVFTLTSSGNIASIKSLPEQENCTFDSFEVTWSYEFFSSAHCMKVVLDFGPNVTDFIRQLNYSHYGFTFRELGKDNIYASRKPINERTNTLFIENVNYRPYIICVTFYKKSLPASQSAKFQFTDANDYDLTTNTSLDPFSVNGSSTMNDSLLCQKYSNIIGEDERTHDIDLCIDIDTHEIFYTELDHSVGIKNPKFIMALFMMVLIAFMLSAIAFVTYSIQKIKKKEYIEQLRAYIHHKLETIHLEKRSTKSSGSIISHHSANDNKNKIVSDQPVEIDRFIVSKAKVSFPNETASNEPDTVMFHIGEAEEDPRCIGDDHDDVTDLAIAHLLDDKPWGRSRPIKARNKYKS
jgi:hypothetical protein